jgi:hypothetical protein
LQDLLQKFFIHGSSHLSHPACCSQVKRESGGVSSQSTVADEQRLQDLLQKFFIHGSSHLRHPACCSQVKRESGGVSSQTGTWAAVEEVKEQGEYKIDE